MSLDNHIHHAFLVVSRGGKERLHPAGRLLVKDGHVHHLEDYHGLLDKEVPAGALDDYIMSKMATPGSGLKIASQASIKNGLRPDLIPEAELTPLLPHSRDQHRTAAVQAPVMPKFPSVWHYTRAGHDQPHVLEAKSGKITLDGNVLKDDEVHAILDNVRTGAGKLRYVKSGIQNKVMKMEQSMRLVKADMDVDDALAHLDSLEGEEKTKHAIASIRKLLFEDPMNPGVGNKLAYEKFRAKNRPGVWTSMDVNDMKHLNDTQGHEAGDALIRGFGGAARSGVDPAHGKLFRAGGDEYVMWHPDEASAYRALRQIRHHVEQVPPIGGTHKISFSAGVGPDFDTADRALYEAKKGKYVPGLEKEKVRAHKPGAVPHLAHSLMPGSSGPVPLTDDQVHPQVPDLGDLAPSTTPST